MVADTEGEVGIALAAHVEALGRFEDPLVEVGRRIQEHDLIALTDLLPAMLEVPSCRPLHVQDRRHPADEFFDSHAQAFGMIHQNLLLIRVETQELHGAASDVARRLGTSNQKQQGLVDQLVIGELPTIDLGIHEDADQVVGRLAALALAERLHVVAVLGESLTHGTDRVLVESVGGEGHDVGPVTEPREILVRNAQETADHGERQQGCHLLDEVALAPGRHGVDQARGDAPDLARLLCQLIRSEALGHELSQGPMTRLVLVDHRRRRWKIRATSSAGARKELGVPRGPDDVFVAGEAPGPALLVPVDGRFVAQPSIDRKRVLLAHGQKPAVEKIQSLVESGQRQTT